MKFYVGIGEPEKIPEKISQSMQTPIKQEKQPTDKEKLQMKRICESRNWKSPVCNNRDLYYKLKNISQEVWVNYWLMLWITNAESNIWSNFAWDCKWTNNRSWLKRKKTKENENIKIKLPHKWCRLYPFEDIEDFRYSFAYSLKYWYIDKWAKTPELISRNYVKNDWVIKEWRSKRVRYYMVD